MIVYCVLAHNNPKHLHRLITAINTPYSKIFLNLDTFYPTEFSELCLSKRINNTKHTGWANWSTIEATINLLQYGILQDVTHIVLLSGSDYPIVDIDYINDFFNTYKDINFMSCKKLPWPEGNKLEIRIPKDFDIVFPKWRPYCGYAYWAITKDAAKYLLEQWNDRKRLFLQLQTIFPVEFYFQTVLFNSGKFNIDQHIMYYIHLNGKHGPELLTKCQYEAAKQLPIHSDAYGIHECLFARKFNDQSIFLD